MTNFGLRFMSRIFLLMPLSVSTHAITATPNSAGTLTFKDHGKVLNQYMLPELAKLSVPKDWNVYEPHERQDRHYRVIPFNQVMDKVYGPRWRQAEEILFTCSDGYQPSIPTQKFLNYDAGLAIPKSPSDKFELTNTLQNNERVQLGPYYLIWDNKKYPALLQEGASDIPYQVVGVDLIEFSTKFPKLYPRNQSSEVVKRGFLQFRKYCLNCHTINGDGGGKAPELNIPMNVTEYWQKAPLRQWLSEPSSVRRNTTMPGLAKELPDREKVIDDILSYLEAMSKNKTAL